MDLRWLRQAGVLLCGFIAFYAGSGLATGSEDLIDQRL
jgi:hypothetical protein